MQTSQNQSNSIYTLLSPREQWRQALIYPVAGVRENGVALDRRVSNHILWIELASGKVWCLILCGRKTFISYRELELISQRLETLKPVDVDDSLKHLATLIGSLKIKLLDMEDINQVAEELVREEIRAAITVKLSLKLSEENVRKEARPHKAIFVSGLLCFNDALDREALEILGKDELLDADDAAAYNFLVHPVTRIQNYRRQAVQTFPLLGHVFTGNTTDYRHQRLRQNVDSGNPLLPVLSDYFRCQLPLVRFLVGKGYALVGEEWRQELDLMVDVLGMVKQDYWPETNEDWQLFRRWLYPVVESMGNIRRREYPDTLANCLNELVRGGYERIPARLAKQGITMVDITTIPDFVKALGEWAGQVGVSSASATNVLWQYSVLKIGTLSHRWHEWLVRRVDTEDSCIEESDIKENGWTTFINKTWIYNGMSVVPLNLPWLLQQEGRRMNHCVGTYVSLCRYFGAHIFSIRDSETGISLSTMELHIESGRAVENEIVICQHRGKNNAEPSAECRITEKEFLKHLKETVTREQFKTIQLELNERRGESNEYRMLFDDNDTPPVWPKKRLEEFRGLLSGYPLLENLGQEASQQLLSRDEVEGLLSAVAN